MLQPGLLTEQMKWAVVADEQVLQVAEMLRIANRAQKREQKGLVFRAEAGDEMASVVVAEKATLVAYADLEDRPVREPLLAPDVQKMIEVIP